MKRSARIKKVTSLPAKSELSVTSMKCWSKRTEESNSKCFNWMSHYGPAQTLKCKTSVWDKSLLKLCQVPKPASLGFGSGSFIYSTCFLPIKPRDHFCTWRTVSNGLLSLALQVALWSSSRIFQLMLFTLLCTKAPCCQEQRGKEVISWTQKPKITGFSLVDYFSKQLCFKSKSPYCSFNDLIDH